MRLATRSFLAAVALLLAAGPASAQNDVTFQVDLNDFIDSCQFDPATDAVQVRGSFNGFGDTTPLADGDGDGIYTVTVSLPEGAIDYKFWTTPLEWEDDVPDNGTNNRDYTVVAGAQTIAVVDYNKTVTNQCGGADTYDVTFQVDMSQFVASCQFDPATDAVQIRGTFNGYGDTTPLADGDGDGIYTVTVALPAGNVSYKFWASPDGLTWENNVNDGGANANDRDYVVTTEATQTVPVVTYNKPVADACGQTTESYEIDFVVDMSVQINRGGFDPATQRVAVAGSFTGWDAGTALALAPESDDPTIYAGTLSRDFDVPSAENFFKFVILSPDGSGGFTITNYESPNADVTATKDGDQGGDRVLSLSGDEPLDGGIRFFTYDNDGDDATPLFYSDITAENLLSGAATVTFVVDLRPAFYALADNGSFTDANGANPVSSIDDVYMNGPLFGESDQADGPGEGTVVDWATWTAAGLGDARKLGTYNATDSTYSITLTYSEGATRVLKGKLSVNGWDNEGGPFDDKFVTITEGTQTIHLIFGAQTKENGSISDETDSFTTFDPYILIDETATPPTAEVVRRGGENDRAVASENRPALDGLTVGAPYPNPAAGRARIDLVLDRPMDVAVRLFDVTGRLVGTLAEGPRAAGAVSVELDTAGLAAGLYLVRVDADGQTAARRISVLR